MAFRTEPHLPGRELEIIDLEIESVGRFFRVEPPGFQATEGSLDATAVAINRLLTMLWLKSIENVPVVHAASANINGRRLAFVGDKRAGKTTLMLRLIQEGYAVHGDENLVITDEGALSYPRSLHVKAPSLDVLPALADRIRSMPSVSNWVGDILYICPPDFTGSDWTISARAVDDLVVLEPNFGGSSVLSPLTREQAFARLMEFSFFPATGRTRAAARLRKLVAESCCWRLQTGCLDQTISHLRKVFVSE
jgi:hypothetical protein